MSKRSGFGAIGARLNGGNPYLVVELQIDIDAYITGIACGFSPVQGDAITSFDAGMVTLIKGIVAGNASVPSPDAPGQWFTIGVGLTNDGPSLVNPIFEHRWGSQFGFSAEMSREFFFGDRGLQLEAKQTYSVILPYPMMDGSTYGSTFSPEINASLAVNGHYAQGKDLYKNVR